jgi:hypothetical protein
MPRPVTIAVRCEFLENSMSTSVKLLNPRNADTKYIGLEPDWQQQPAEHKRQSLITRAFNFYNYFYNQKNAKEMIVTWLTANKRKKDLEIVNRIPDNDIIPTLGWICRMNTVGLELTKQETETVEKLLQDQITVYRQKHQKQEQKKAKGQSNSVAVAPPVTIQDRLREKIIECAGDIEGNLDDFIANKCRQVEKFSPLDLFRARNLSPQLIGMIAQIWHAKKAELEQVQKARDSQLVEGYSNFNKTELKNLIKFADQVINDCASYVQIKKVERKPRAKKPVSTEKLVAKFRYLKNFGQFKLVSESPTKLVNASEAWLFDTKKRKLIHVVADSHSGSFTVKNTSIIGFDAAQSQQKTLRKPAEQLKAFMASAKPAMRKFFKDIKSVETKFNGRSSEDMVILKAW